MLCARRPSPRPRVRYKGLIDLTSSEAYSGRLHGIDPSAEQLSAMSGRVSVLGLHACGRPNRVREQRRGHECPSRLTNGGRSLFRNGFPSRACCRRRDTSRGHEPLQSMSLVQRGRRPGGRRALSVWDFVDAHVSNSFRPYGGRVAIATRPAREVAQKCALKRRTVLRGFAEGPDEPGAPGLLVWSSRARRERRRAQTSCVTALPAHVIVRKSRGG
jgi:hypothetical protein